MEPAKTKKELYEVKMERDILKKQPAYFAGDPLPRYAPMKEMRLKYPAQIMKRVLSVRQAGIIPAGQASFNLPKTTPKQHLLD